MLSALNLHLMEHQKHAHAYVCKMLRYLWRTDKNAAAIELYQHVYIYIYTYIHMYIYMYVLCISLNNCHCRFEVHVRYRYYIALQALLVILEGPCGALGLAVDHLRNAKSAAGNTDPSMTPTPTSHRGM